jgi:hypothetical protein
VKILHKLARKTYGPQKLTECQQDLRSAHVLTIVCVFFCFKQREEDEMGGLAERMKKMRNTYKIKDGKTDGKRPLGKPRRRQEYNIKMGLKEIGYEDADWIHLAQDRDQWRALVNAVMSICVPLTGICRLAERLIFS